MTKPNKKLSKAIEGILSPLEQSGDSLTIGISGGEKITISFEDKKKMFPKKNTEKEILNKKRCEEEGHAWPDEGDCPCCDK